MRKSLAPRIAKQEIAPPSVPFSGAVGLFNKLQTQKKKLLVPPHTYTTSSIFPKIIIQNIYSHPQYQPRLIQACETYVSCKRSHWVGI